MNFVAKYKRYCANMLLLKHWKTVLHYRPDLGKDTRFHHSEKLDKGEIMIAQFTEHTSAIKIRGRVEVLTRHGRLRTDE